MAVTSRNHHRGVANPDHRAIFAHNPVFRLKSLTAQARCFRGLNNRVIFRWNVTRPVAGADQPFLLRVTRYGLDLGTDIVPLAVDTEFGDITDRGDLFHKRAVLVFSVDTRLLRFLSRSDIVAYACRNAVG